MADLTDVSPTCSDLGGATGLEVHSDALRYYKGKPSSLSRRTQLRCACTTSALEADAPVAGQLHASSDLR